MEWTGLIRDNLNISIGCLNSKQKKKFIKDKLLKKFNYTCRYCGGRYIKYLRCTDNNICCYPCYIITHINYDFDEEVVICWSKMEQVDIVKKTVDGFINDGKIPEPYEIDKGAKRIKLSTMELSNIFVYIGEDVKNRIPGFLKSYKIFFTQKMKTDFITANLLSNIYAGQIMFIDDTSTTITNNNNCCTTIQKTHRFTNKEVKFFKKCYMCNQSNKISHGVLSTN